MSFSARRHLPLLLASAAGLAVIGWLLLTPGTPTSGPHPVLRPAPGPPPKPMLSLLAEIPDWSLLEAYQNTITRADFEILLTTAFTTGQAWRDVITIDQTGATIKTGSAPEDPVFRLNFADPAKPVRPPRHWRATAELPPAPVGKPLAGLKIAIDPGHIGGEWAKMEERWLLVGDGPPVCEGDMTLLVAKLLRPRLEALGATVSLVRETSEPVTPLRPDTLKTLAQDSSPAGGDSAALQRFAQGLFYRTAEIRARGDLINHTLKPDLVLCLHFNAEPWGNPLEPALIDRTHLHLILNGGYNDQEVLLADQRHAMLKKILQGIHAEEILVGSTVARTFAEISGLPAYIYPPTSGNVRAIPGQPYLWARNLLANRIYDCPVIYMEPYVMNSTIDHPRLQAGDYEGLKEVDGKMQASVFREYADAMAAGLAEHYATIRKQE